MTIPLNRRKFIRQTAALAATGIALPAHLHAKTAKNNINIGFIGTGLRGRNHVNNILDHAGVQCTAICDINPAAIAKTNEIFERKGKKPPKAYDGGDYAYEDMLDKEPLDAVIIATNWKWHTPMCVAAMEAGVYVGTEVSGAFDVDDCWNLVETHEKTGTHLMFLENVCYRRDVMAMLNMVRDNLFGEIIHCQGGYQHDLRHIKFNDGDGGLVFGKEAYGEAKWRTQHSLHRNGELYPTHGLGPVAVMLDQNRGNRLVSLSSTASKARSLKNFIKKHEDGGENHPYYKLNWALGDVVTSVITTARGETIVITHDTNLPRPYSLGFRVQGTEGLAEVDYYTKRIYMDGKSNPHRWDDGEKWLEKYDHKLWKQMGEEAVGSGHGGMDFFLDRAFVQSVSTDTPPVLDVYDAAVWRAITPLSEISIKQGGAPQPIPDFTRGKWMTRKPVFGLGDV